ncbi:MAG: ABC transporter permease, partial [Bacteroidota bacterium]
MKQSIPKYALRFFRWYCNPDYLEDLEGDIIERFYKNQKKGLNARLLFYVDVLRLFRPGLMRPVSLGASWINWDMIRHHFLIGKRVIIGDKTYAAVSIFGLGLGFAAALYLLTFTKQQNSFDTFHKNHKSIYRVTTSYARSDEPVRTLATSPPSLTGIMQQMPEVEQVVRTFQYMWDLTLTAGDVKYRETRSLFVEPGFLEVFDFQLTQGNPKTCLSNIRSIVLTESLASKYFGTQDPMGKTMKIDGASNLYEITGIIKDPPLETHIHFDFLVSYETIDWWWEGEAKESWNPHEFYTYVQLVEAANPEAFETKLNQLYLVDQGAELELNGHIQYFDIQELASIHLYSNLENELLPELQGNGRLVKVLTGIGWLILVIGWINYINLSTAKTFSRSNEVAVRRKIGASGNQLNGQFLVEAALVSCFAIIFGLLVLVLFIDQLAELTGAKISVTTILEQKSFIYPGLLMLVGAVFSGWYHSKGIAKLQSVSSSSFGGSKRQNTNSGRALIVLQFITSIALIVCTTIVHYQLDYMSKADLGFDLN